ncbi:MAG: hypothetical protein IMZ54_04830 [Acidobacteria bacterium]|nr:hypothetical protein [Acidobacteriota bacterium]
MATLAFTTAVKNRELIVFDIDGVVYHFTPSKKVGMDLAIWDASDADSMAGEFSMALVDWFSSGLPDEEALQIRARLEDPKDEFDGTDIGRIAQGLMTEVSGRPFGSPPASATSPQSGGKPSTRTPSSTASIRSTSRSTASAVG